MNTSHVTRVEYIILFPRGHGEFAPATFSDGTLVVYGNEAEAKEDAGGDGLVAEVTIPKTQTR